MRPLQEALVLVVKHLYSYQAGLQLTQPLFAVGSLAAIDIAEKDVRLRKLDAEITARDLVANVIQGYFQLVLANRNLQTLRKQNEIVQDSLKDTQQRYANGRSQLIDVLQVRTEIALLRGQLSEAESQVKVAAATLASLLGDSRIENITVRDVLEAPDVESVRREIDFKEFRLLELEQNRLSLEQVEDRKRVSLGAHLPNLSLSAGYNYNSYKRSEWFDDASNSWVVGLQLTIPLFSGFSSVHQQRALLSQQAQLEFDRIHTVNQTNERQITSRQRLDAAYQSIVSGAEALKIATSSAREAKKRYQYSTIDFIQFIIVQKSLIQAESALNTSKYNYLIALANYYSASGQNMLRLVEFLERNK